MFDATYKIVIVGDAGCGKTTLTKRFLTNVFSSSATMTIGVDFEVKILLIEKKRIKLQIWDFGGEERFRFLLPTYLRGANGALFMYDVTNYSSLAHIDDWLMIIRKEFPNEASFPIIAVGGKADLSEDREVSSEEGISISKSRKLHGFIETSAKTGENVEETFENLARLMMKNSELL